MSNGIPDLEARADRIFEALPTASAAERDVLLRVLGRIGGGKAMTAILQQAKSPNADLREAAIRALADWPTLDGYGPLLSVAQSKEKFNLRVLALRGCVRIVENAPINAATAVRYHERTLAAAERAEEKRLVLGALGSLRRSEALKLVLPYLADDTLGVDAATAAGKIASGITGDKDEAGESEVITDLCRVACPASHSITGDSSV